jgi:hypothetical protein
MPETRGRRIGMWQRLCILLSVALTGLALAPSASASTPQDTVTATGSSAPLSPPIVTRFGNVALSGLNVTAQSGTSGQNPSGSASFSLGELMFSGPVTCLAVTGPDRGAGTSTAPTAALLRFQDSVSGFFFAATSGQRRQRGRHDQLCRGPDTGSGLLGDRTDWDPGNRAVDRWPRRRFRRSAAADVHGPVQERRVAQLPSIQEPGGLRQLREHRQVVHHGASTAQIGRSSRRTMIRRTPPNARRCRVRQPRKGSTPAVSRTSVRRWHPAHRLDRRSTVRRIGRLSPREPQPRRLDLAVGDHR